MGNQLELCCPLPKFHRLPELAQGAEECLRGGKKRGEPVVTTSCFHLHGKEPRISANDFFLVLPPSLYSPFGGQVAWVEANKSNLRHENRGSIAPQRRGFPSSVPSSSSAGGFRSAKSSGAGALGCLMHCRNSGLCPSGCTSTSFQRTRWKIWLLES